MRGRCFLDRIYRITGFTGFERRGVGAFDGRETGMGTGEGVFAIDTLGDAVSQIADSKGIGFERLWGGGFDDIEDGRCGGSAWGMDFTGQDRRTAVLILAGKKS